MIPKDYITAWRTHAPWRQDAQVEQDLVISRAIVEMFLIEETAGRLAFRGGTALNKLYLHPPARYEVYPAGTLAGRGLPHSGYKGPKDDAVAARRRLLEAKENEIGFGAEIADAAAFSDHVLDAILAWSAGSILRRGSSLHRRTLSRRVARGGAG